ncbi:DNA-directed RNA polymerase subunit beta' [Tanacetum coccineum]
MENKVVQSHIRGEYVSLFLNLCAILRIRHQFIAFETPTIELLKEKNHALEDMINAMFLSLGLSHGMWGKEIGKSSRIDDEVVQDQRQRDDNDLQDERQDQPKEEEVEPRRSKKARTKKSFGSDFFYVKMILAIATLRNREVHQMDVKMTFLNGDLEKVLYMNQPEGFMAPGLESKVCRLVKSLFGLRKVPKQGHQFSPYHVRMWI